MGTTWGAEQGCFGSSSWREVVVLAGGRDKEILIRVMAKAEFFVFFRVHFRARRGTDSDSM
jgi:hypothetical protein